MKPLVKFVFVVCVLAACCVCWMKVTEPSVTSDTSTAAAIHELSQLCGEDRILATRLTSRLYPAIEIGRQHGQMGLKTLDLFGDDAVYLAEKKPTAFMDLMTVAELPGAFFSSTTGRWRAAIVGWATAGTLPLYLEKLETLDDDDREILSEVPDALPLLFANTPIANRMMKRFGNRAWELFQGCDLRHETSIERIATALEHRGELMLRLNEQFGPTVSWLLVPSSRDVDAILPDLFVDAVSELAEENASALFVTNYDDIARMVFDERRDPDSIRSTFVFIAALPDPEHRQWVADSPYCIRLLLETCDGKPIGQQVYTNCGPSAATLLYQPGGFGVVSDSASAELTSQLATERLAAMLALSHEGWPALNLLWKYQNVQSLRDVLRRNDLCQNLDDPLICRVIRKLAEASDVRGQIDVILKKPAEQLLAEEYPETNSEKIANWIPGYVALKTSGDWLKGHHVSTLDVSFAVVDGVGAAFGVGAIVSQAVKTTGRQAVKNSIQQAGRKLSKDAVRDTAENISKRVAAELPGAVLASLRSMAANGVKPDVTQLARTVTATAKKVGVRSWGKLDRRIIMRGDRRVIVDFTTKEVRDEAGKQIVEEAVVNAALDFGPLLLEQTIQGLQISN